MPRPSRKADVLHAAVEHFYRDGIGATGVDALASDAGVAKMTLYSNFGSKDELVVAYLDERDRRFFERLDEELAARDDALDRALAVVDLYQRYLDEDGFRGCAFVNAAAELPEDHPGRAAITRHKARLLERWTHLMGDLEVQDPRQLARECYFLLEGAFAHAGVGLDDDRLSAARAFIADRLRRERA